MQHHRLLPWRGRFPCCRARWLLGRQSGDGGTSLSPGCRAAGPAAPECLPGLTPAPGRCRGTQRRPRVPVPSAFSSFSFLLPWLLLRGGPGRCGEAAALARQWLAGGRGRAACPAPFLKAGTGRRRQRAGAPAGPPVSPARAGRAATGR